MDKTARIATWSKYYDQADVLVIEDGDSWRELTVDDLVGLLAEAIKLTTTEKAGILQP